MEISLSTVDGVNVVKLVGDIDGKTAPVAQGKILPLAQAGCKILIDMSEVSYMSSAGLRMLLSLHRQVSGGKGKIALAGLSEDVMDTMSATGFLRYFAVATTVEEGLAALR